MNLRNRIGGKIAKQHGDQFETLLSNSAQIKGFDVTRIPNGCKTLGAHKLIRVQSPYDFVFVRSLNEIIFADAKSTDSASFSHSKITPHQIDKLYKIFMKGPKAGYIVEFRGVNQVVWFGANLIKTLNKGQSLKPSDGLLLGSRFGIDLGRLFGV